LKVGRNGRFGEGLLKTTNRVLSKFLGSTSGSAKATFVATIVIGIVQTIWCSWSFVSKGISFSVRGRYGQYHVWICATLMTVVVFRLHDSDNNSGYEGGLALPEVEPRNFERTRLVVLSNPSPTAHFVQLSNMTTLWESL